MDNSLKPNFVFFGTPEFATIVLEKIIKAGFVPKAVVCNPDRPVGRKKIITPPPVKTRIMNYELGIRNKIKILQPEKLDEKFHNSLFMLHNSFDFFIVAAYAKIIPKKILEIPKLGIIGVHPSLLPKYRGASPIQNAILNGDKETGATLYLMDEKLDHGLILAQRILNYELGIMNYGELSKNLAEISGDLLIETLPKFLAGEIKPQIQNEAQATYAKKFTTQDGFIEFSDLEKARSEGGQIAINIDRKIRALNPEPGTFTLSPSKDSLPKRMKILEAELTDENKLKLKTIQYEGKNPIKIYN